MRRREFLKRGLESAALLYCAVELPVTHAAAPPGEPESPRRRLQSLPAFVDTLIPVDSTPSASQLGLDQALIHHANEIENYTRLLELGCAWLDAISTRLHGAGFDDLNQARRDAVVALAEASPPNSIPRLFFERVRFDLFGLYYAKPASWEGLGLASPSLPTGYSDFTRPPRKPTRG